MLIDPGLPRRQWHGNIEPDFLMVEYHDTGWGIPVHDDRRHFEYLVPGAFQAGLSWSTVLNKREIFRAAYDDFYPESDRALHPAPSERTAWQPRHHP